MNITYENIIKLNLNPESRADLLKAIALENDNSLNIRNAIADTIYNLKAIDESQIKNWVENIINPTQLQCSKYTNN